MSWSRERNPEIFAEIDQAFEMPEILRYVSVTKSRMLVAGTNSEVRELKKRFGDIYQGRRVAYSSSIYRFWEDFLGSNNLDEVDSLSLPNLVISTGFMRSSVYFNETVPVEDKLREICQRFGIPLEFIAPLHS